VLPQHACLPLPPAPFHPVHARVCSPPCRSLLQSGLRLLSAHAPPPACTGAAAGALAHTQPLPSSCAPADQGVASWRMLVEQLLLLPLQGPGAGAPVDLRQHSSRISSQVWACAQVGSRCRAGAPAASVCAAVRPPTC